MSSDYNLQTIIEITGLDQKSAIQLLELNDGNLDRAINYHIEATSIEDIATSTSSVPAPLNNLDDYDDCPAIIPPKKEQLLMPVEDNFRPRKQRRTASHNVCPLRNFQREGELQEAKMMEANILLGTNSSGCSSSSINKSSSNKKCNTDTTHRINISSDKTNLLNVKENGQQEDFRTVNNIAYQTATASTSTTNFKRKLADGVTIHNKDERLMKKTRLGDLFRPPVDLSFAGPLESARKYASSQNQWIIVNLQDNTEFQSQVLNRDLWSDYQLNKMIKKYFVFWQVAIDNSEGRRFQSFYNVNSIPYISIIDPRTGEEKCNYINGYEFTSVDFLKKLIKHIQENSLYPNNEENLQKNSQNEFYEFIRYIEKTTNQSLLKNEVNQKTSNDTTTTATTTSSTTTTTATLSSLNNVNIVSNSATSNKKSSNKKSEKCLTEEEQLLLATKNSLIEFCSQNDESSNDSINSITATSNINATTSNKLANDSYKKYLDNNCDDPKTKLILRLPDSKKVVIEWPKTTKLIALKLYIEQFYKSYVNIESYKIISAYPRQNLLELDINCVNLADAHLHPTAILHLQIEE